MIEFRKILRAWYKENGRQLPWRETADPYAIWISEIILQQTRVDQGGAYYERFLKKFPDVESLAMANESEVLKTWQGLGYYSRARNLHTAAQQIVQEFQGRFPNRYEEIRQLKGIGDYTAAAIGSIAFQLRYAAVDGNVYRVLSRIFGIATPIDSTKGKKQFAELANQLMEESDPGLFNQAMMEFGALQCVPRNPDCLTCPLNDCCFAFKNRAFNQFPVKAKQLIQRDRYFTFLVLQDSARHIYLHKRPVNDIWANLFQFPLLESEKLESPEELMESEKWDRLFNSMTLRLGTVTSSHIHLLSHQRLHIRFWEIVAEEGIKNETLLKVSLEEVHHYPVPKPIENYLKKMGINSSSK